MNNDVSADWFKDAIIYELHVRSFMDSNGDGMGDFRGLTSKLDYLVDLGVTALWLLPFYPSPWKDDGYDTSDYRGVHPRYGTLADFKRFLRAAHDRGLRVITEVVVNHTSNEHPWFQRARKAAPGTKYRDFYVWSDTPDRYADARVIFSDTHSSNWSWDPLARAYYWHRFYSDQPDLNFENPMVQSEVLKVVDFWLDMGVDGLRLDAVPYLYEAEGTNCENLPKTHAFLKKLRRHIDEKFTGKMLLAEANQWPEDAVAYFGDDDECHMAFHFPIMPRLFMGLQMEDRHPIVDILEQTPDIPHGSQWAIFLRNHDELTLEMVTDEERDYMYRVYAADPRQRLNQGIRRRLSPLLEGDRRKIELLNSLLFSLPGSPIVYYGDEIGMGDNVYLGDRNGVRTPMHWSNDKNAGFSAANPQRLYLPVIIDPQYHYETVNVETHQASPSSYLWWMKRVIATRKGYQAFSRGEMKIVNSGNMHVLSFLRIYQGEVILVVANFSRHIQVVDLDLADYAGLVPTEVFSGNWFPTIGGEAYVMNIGGYECYWFSIAQTEATVAVGEEEGPAIALTASDWRRMSEPFKKKLEPSLVTHTQASRWFRSKDKNVRGMRIVDHISTGGDGDSAWLVMLEAEYSDESMEMYMLPLALAVSDYAEFLLRDAPNAVICRCTFDGEEGVLYEATHSGSFRTTLLSVIERRRRLKGRKGRLLGYSSPRAKKEFQAYGEDAGSRVLSLEQSNTSVLYGDKFFLKLYRKLEEGKNPEVEILRHLGDDDSFGSVPSFIGNIDYESGDGNTSSAGILVGYVSGEGDAWSYTLSAVDRYFERVLTGEGDKPTLDQYYLDLVGLLGQRTAEMHKALAAAKGDQAFVPESFSLLYQRSLFQSIKTLYGRVRRTITKLTKSDKTGFADRCNAALKEFEPEAMEVLQALTDHKFRAQKSRIHGDYHLGQVLFTGRDFVIIDFEGEPARALGERRLRYSALRDVAGMIRSFHYAVSSRYLGQRDEDRAVIKRWVAPWFATVSERFLTAYLETINDSPLLPEDDADRTALLDALILEKAVYELGYEMANRPSWVEIPLEGIRYILNARRA